MRQIQEAVKQQETKWLISAYQTPNGYMEKNKKLMRLIRKVIFVRTGKWI